MTKNDAGRQTRATVYCRVDERTHAPSGDYYMASAWVHVYKALELKLAPVWWLRFLGEIT